MDKGFAAAALVTAAAVAANARLQGENTLLSQESNANDASQHENVFVPRKMEASIVRSAETILDNIDRSLKNSNSNNDNDSDNEIQNESELWDGDADEADIGVLNNDRKLAQQFDCDSCDSRPLIDADVYVPDLVIACLEKGYDDPDCPGIISCWDTSKVTNLTYAFYNQTTFNEPLNCWDTSNVKSFYATFSSAYEFNQDLSSFKTPKAFDFSYMFYAATVFDQDISGWKTTRVEYMGGMFYYAEAFNQKIGKWDVSKNYELGGTFSYAKSFNSPLNAWDTSLVYNFKSCFEGAESFNQKISDWNTTEAKTMAYMFMGAESFDKPIGSWTIDFVTNMTYMFDSSYFNQPLDEWKTTRVLDMYAMFASAKFNQPIDSWGVKNVERFDFMFNGAEDFNQCLNSWPDKLTKDTVTVTEMFTESSCPIQTEPDPKEAPWCSETCGVVAGPCDDFEETFILKKQETSCASIAGLKKKKRKKKCKLKVAKKKCPGTCDDKCKVPKFCKDDPDYTIGGNPNQDCVFVQSNPGKCKKDKVFKNCRKTCDPACTL
jgi:hypothetical protein